MAETKLSKKHLALIEQLSKEFAIHDAGQPGRVEAILAELESSLRGQNAKSILAELRKASKHVYLDPMELMQWQAGMCSWGDTLSDSETLHLVRGLNKQRPAPGN